MSFWLKSTAAAAALSVAMATGAAAQDDNQEDQAEDNGVVLQDIVTTTHDDFGDYLTDGRMMALYMFTADEQGTDDSDPVTNCTEGCLEAWPPLTIEGEPQVGPAAEPDMVGEFERSDGDTQITYNGWPLYYYAEDDEPGDTEGQDVEGGGGEWYLLNPQGEPIED